MSRGDLGESVILITEDRMSDPLKVDHFDLGEGESHAILQCFDLKKAQQLAIACKEAKEALQRKNFFKSAKRSSNSR